MPLFGIEWSIWSGIAIMVLALLWDVVLGEPRRFHPVSGVGVIIGWLERKAPGRGRVRPFLYGLGMAVLLPAALGVAAWYLGRGLVRVHEVSYLVVGTYLLKSCFSVRELGRAALGVANELEADRLDEARGRLTSLVSRDTVGLSPPLAASAAVESVAENSTDGFLAPWLAFALFGLPGAVAYRALNTMDSMLGYHGRYEYLGKAAARMDDLVNFIPARLGAVLIVVAAWLPGSSARRAWRTMWHQHRRTESPNAGWTMSAMAGALGVELQKVGHYKLGQPGGPVGSVQIRQAVAMMHCAAALAFLLALGVMVIRYGTF
jgi:adenosylcobinamide-phosphate synthase